MAALSPETVASVRAKLWDAGYRPVAVYNPDAPGPSPGKRPWGEAWQIQARLNPPQAATEWPRPEALNTGVLCDGLRAVDIDVDNPTLAQSCRDAALDMLGDAPMRFRRNSPRCLLLYRAATGEPHKASVAGTFGKVEVLGHGNQFVAFGRHHEGADLEWFPEPPGQEFRDSLPVVTEAQVEAFLARCATILGAKQAPPRLNGQDHTPGDAQADPLRIAAALATISNSGAPDWEAWNRVGMAIWRATAGSSAGWEAFNAWSQRNAAYDTGTTRERWDHYFTSPPTHIGAGTIFHMARSAPPQEEPSPTTEQQPPEQPGYSAEAFTAASLSLLEPYDWVYQKIMVARYFCALGAPPGTGKSALIVAIAISIATGKALLGGQAPEQGNVWIINLEDPREAVLKMVWACCEFYGIEPVTLEGRLFINSGRDHPLVVAAMVDGAALRLPIVEALTKECQARKIRGLFIDPVVDTHSLPENDNITMNDYCAIWNQLAEAADLAVLLSMHFKKGGQAGDPDAFRGASAIIGKARSAITLGVMATEDAAKLNVPLDRRAYHLRLDNAKRNLSPPPSSADWLRLESVDLTTGDSIQAIRLWSPPSPWENLPMARAIEALTLIDAGSDGEFYTASRRGRSNERWAGHVITRCANGTGISDEQAAIILAQWLQSGMVMSGVYHSPSQRREMPCIRVDQVKLAEMRLQSPLPETPWE